MGDGYAESKNEELFKELTRELVNRYIDQMGSQDLLDLLSALIQRAQ